MPELIKNEDVWGMQDCDMNEAKKSLPKLRAQALRKDFSCLEGRIYATNSFIKPTLD